MERNAIVPKQVAESEKAKIRQQLAQRSNSMVRRADSYVSKADAKEAPDFFKEMRTDFLKKCSNMGYDQRQVEDFIDQKGLPELNYELFVEAQTDNRYDNPLYEQPEQNVGQSVMYEYEPHEKPLN